MKKIFITFLLFFAFSVSTWAQKDEFNPINTGVNSLGIAPDSRGGGMSAPLLIRIITHSFGTLPSIRLLSVVQGYRSLILLGYANW